MTSAIIILMLIVVTYTSVASAATVFALTADFGATVAMNIIAGIMLLTAPHARSLCVKHVRKRTRKKNIPKSQVPDLVA